MTPLAINPSNPHHQKFTQLECARGIAAICVFLAHFAQTFFPAVYAANDKSHGLGETAFASSIFNVILNANFAVCFFFVLSAYVLTYKKYGEKRATPWFISGVKRYPRLAIPALAAALFGWLLAMSPLSLYAESTQLSGATMPDFFAHPGGISNPVIQGLFSTFFGAIPDLNPVLWTMKVEFFGSIMIFLLCFFAANLGKFRYLLFALAGFVIYRLVGTYYLSFIFGALLNEDFLSIKRLHPTIRRALLSGVACLALLCASYPYYGSDAAPWRILPAVADPFIFWHVIGAWLVVWILVSTSLFRRVFSGPVSEWIGRLSFPIYLVHFPILLTVGTYLIVHLSPMGYLLSAGISFAVCLVICLCCAMMFYHFVDKPAVRCANWLAALLTRRIAPN